MSTMKEKMHTGELYLPGDEEIIKEQVVYQDLLCEYNQTKPSESEKRAALLKKCLVIIQCSVLMLRLLRQGIQFCLNYVKKCINTICRFTLENVVGLVRVQS